jgi:hypothetical protein
MVGKPNEVKAQGKLNEVKFDTTDLLRVEDINNS